jgi:FkbM family methyltransferase
MSYRRALIRVLDRPGGRTLLGAALTRFAQRFAPDVQVYFRDGMWMHQEGRVIFVDSPTVNYRISIFPSWANELERAIADASDRWFHVYQPRPGDFVVDVGAGKGEDTIVFSRAVGPTGRVLSIEPHPTTFRCLQRFCELNHLNNVVTRNYAVIDGVRSAALENMEGWQANHIVGSDTKDSIRVAGISLNELVKREGLTHVDFLKMNIEGAEGVAIREMDDMLRITRTVCISCHDFRADNGEEEFFRTEGLIQEYVGRSGFRILSRKGDSRPSIAYQVNAVRD